MVNLFMSDLRNGCTDIEIDALTRKGPALLT